MKHHRPRLLFLLAVLCLAVCLLAGCAARAATADPDADLPTIVIGSDSYPPFNYLSADGQPTGIGCGACHRGIPPHGLQGAVRHH